MTPQRGRGGGPTAERGWEEHLHDLPDAMYTTPRMSEIFSGTARVERMLRFEAALAAAEAEAGLVPAEAAAAIARACAELAVDIPRLAKEGAVAGTIAVPVIDALRAAVPEDARGYVHLGSTSQDVIDTAAVLQMREGLDAIVEDLGGVAAACAELCRRHRDTPMAGRTLLQQGVPITFGVKAAGWLTGAVRQARRLREVRMRDLVLQFGGAAGTLASLGERGVTVAELLAEELGLEAPALPWHVERSRIAEVASQLAITAGLMTKIATDVVLLMQTEVAEVAEASGPGKGRSSAMPQKRNPVDTLIVLAAGRQAASRVGGLLGGMAHEHERALGAWQVEWAAVPEIFRLTGSAVARTRTALDQLEVRPERMRANLDSGGGQPMAEALATALAAHVGRHEGSRIVAELSQRALAEGGHLSDVAAADQEVRGVLDPEEIQAALEPRNYLGSAPVFVDRALAEFADFASEPTA